MELLHPTDLKPAPLARLLDMSPDVLGIGGSDGYLKLVNPAWTEVLGHSTEALRTTPYLDLVHPEDLDATRALIEHLIAGGRSTDFTCRVRRGDGEYRWMLWSAQGAAGDDCFYVVGKDITERILLEDELQRRARNLERANAELQEFAYIASHDLAEPLRMVASYLELLQRRYGGRLDATADEFIGYAVGGAVRMRALIDDLLAYSRVGTREMERAEVDLGALLGHVLLGLGPSIAEAGAQVEVEPGLPSAYGDGTQLGQVLQNLIANAVKFRASERAPRVVVAAAQVDGGTAISVADNGIGIGENNQERIFKMFGRLHGRDEYEGTGIGLALCRRICDRHGGRIWVESAPGAGSTFHVWVPGP